MITTTAIIAAILLVIVFVFYLFVKICSMWWLTHLVVAILAAFATHLVLNRDDKSPIAEIPSKLIPLVIVGLVAAAYILAKVLGWLFTLLSLGQCSNWWFETHLAVATFSALATYVLLRGNEEGTVAHTCARHTKTAAISCASYLKMKFNKFDTCKCAEQIGSVTSSGLKKAKSKLSSIAYCFNDLKHKLKDWLNKRKK